MFPRSPTCYAANNPATNSKQITYLSVHKNPIFEMLANSPYIIFCDCCLIALGALGFVVATFPGAVLHIVFISPQKEMLWIYAPGIITSVTNVQPFWYLANMIGPHNPARNHVFAIHIEASMSESTAAVPLPLPALVSGSLGNITPESSFGAFSVEEKIADESILSSIAKKQMIRIDASPVTAFMQNRNSIPNRTNDVRPYYPMRRNIGLIHKKAAIPTFKKVPMPKPARRPHYYMRPKFLSCRFICKPQNIIHNKALVVTNEKSRASGHQSSPIKRVLHLAGLRSKNTDGTIKIMKNALGVKL